MADENRAENSAEDTAAEIENTTVGAGEGENRVEESVTAEDAVTTSGTAPVEEAITDPEKAEIQETADGDSPFSVSEDITAAGGAMSITTPRILLWGSAALATAAFVVAAVFGVMWWTATTGDGVQVAEAREDVTKAAGKAVTAFTELDHENPEEYFERQKAVASKDFRDQIVELEDEFAEAIAEAETKVVSTIQDVGVSEINEHEGNASVLVMVRNEVTQGDAEAVKHMRLEAQMTRADDEDDQDWKLAGVSEVPPVAGNSA